ncbi:MAG: permease prefix domain 1-containing protein [Terrimesophilobacter sp.]
MESLDGRINEWRAAVSRGPAVSEGDADELEGHLREQVTDLEAAGLSSEEAFLIAMRRLGQVDQLTAEYAREHSDRLWKQFAVPTPASGRHTSILAMIGFAVLTAVLVQGARLLAQSGDSTSEWFIRNVSFVVFPVLAAYFVFVRRMHWRRVIAPAVALAVLIAAVNLYPFTHLQSTYVLALAALPFALWFIVGATYLGGRVGSSQSRMNFVRFSGEWLIYYTLIAIGGSVLVGLTSLILTPFGWHATDVLMTWVVPSGAAGAVIVAAWLVEAKKSIVENLAPVLTAIFTPLFAIMLVAAVVAYLISGVWRNFDRELLGGFDVLLLVVLALILYGISARNPTKGPGVTDAIRLSAVGAAIVLDVLVLMSMFARIGEYGFTANRLAVLGLNIIVLVNLVVTAWLLIRILARRAPAIQLERWQTGYLPVFAIWAAAIVLVLPPIFGFA